MSSALGQSLGTCDRWGKRSVTHLTMIRTSLVVKEATSTLRSLCYVLRHRTNHDRIERSFLLVVWGQLLRRQEAFALEASVLARDFDRVTLTGPFGCYISFTVAFLTICRT